MKPTVPKILPFSVSAILALFISLAFPARAGSQSLEAGFAYPPQQARPLVWWHWINGNITKQGMRADLEDMKRVGLGGAQILDASIYLPPGPVRYGTDQWHEHMQYAIRTAAELGLEITLMNCPGWSASGGPWNTPDRSMKQFTWSEIDVEGGKALSVSLPKPPAKLDFYRDVACLAVPALEKTSPRAKPTKALPPLKGITPYKLNTAAAPLAPEQIINLTRLVNVDGLLQHELPPGHWTIIRFGFTTTGSQNHPAQDEGHGLEIDKLDADAVAFQFDHALGRIIREAGPLAGKALSSVLFDSFEAGYQNWTDKLPEHFRQMKGYDLIPFLPALLGQPVSSVPESEAFLRDFRSLVENLIARYYFGTMQRLAHAHGLQVYAEAQGGPLNPTLCNEFVDVPMNEFWVPDTAPRFTSIKQVVSAANVLGRQIVGAESFTAKPEDGRWLAVPANLKKPGDCAFAYGINRLIFHTYTHQPYEGIAPGFTLGRYGTHFGRLNTWWPYAGEWITYLSRCQFLLQQGRTVADLCVVFDETSGYPPPKKDLELPRGYDYDICYPRHLAAMTWKDGAFHLPHGPTYRALILPDKWRADLATLQRLKEFADAGARVIGQFPVGPFGGSELRSAQPQWDKLVASLPKQLPPRATLEAVLKDAGITPDFSASDTNIVAIHRTTAEGDLYFLSNQSENATTFKGHFRVAKKMPELWDPVTGQVKNATQMEIQGGQMTIPLRLEAAGSIFVVFRHALENPLPDQKKTPSPQPTLLPITGPWEVTFQPGRGAPEKFNWDSLIPWNTHNDTGIRYYSGIATYQTKFKLPADFKTANHPCLLQLGKVCDLAEVKLNGVRIGVAWTAPFALEVTGHLQPGNNNLEISVANRWVNRLIGDESLPPDATYATDGSKFTVGRLAELPTWLNNPAALKQRQRFTFATWHFYEKDSPLLDSGLIGPVQLEMK